MFEAPLRFAHRLAGVERLHQSRLAPHRRRILTIGLPLVWFSALLGFVSNWATEGGRRGKSVALFLRDLPGLSLWPLAALLAVVTLGGLSLYAAYPWLVRRRLRAAMEAPDTDMSVPVRYRFDAAGITQTTAELDAFLPWHHVRGLGEDRDHLFLLSDIEGEPIVLARADLTRATGDDVRARVAAHANRTPAPPQPDASDQDPDQDQDRDPDPFADHAGDPNAVRLAFRLTPADRASLVLRTLERPAMRRARIYNAATLIVGLSLIYPGLVAFAWAVDPYRVPLPIAAPLFLEMVGHTFWQPALGAAALVLLAAAFGGWSRRWSAGQLGAELDAEARPGTSYALIDGHGIAVAQGGARARLAWGSFGAPERVGDLIVLPLKWGSVLPLPRRAFDPEALTRFDALAARHLPPDGIDEGGPPAPGTPA